MGTSMGGIAAIAAVAVLGDGRLAGADVDPAAPRTSSRRRGRGSSAVIGDSVAPELELPIAARLPGPGRRFVAARLFDGASRTLGADPRATEPARVIGLVAPVPLLLIHGEADTTVPIADGRRLAALAALAGPSTESWPSRARSTARSHVPAPEDYERRTTDFLRVAIEAARREDAAAADDDGPAL